MPPCLSKPEPKVDGPWNKVQNLFAPAITVIIFLDSSIAASVNFSLVSPTITTLETATAGLPKPTESVGAAAVAGASITSGWRELSFGWISD